MFQLLLMQIGGARVGSAVARKAIDLNVVRVTLMAVHGLRADLRNVSSFIVLSLTHPHSAPQQTCVTDHRFLTLYDHSSRMGR